MSSKCPKNRSDAGPGAAIPVARLARFCRGAVAPLCLWLAGVALAVPAGAEITSAQFTLPTTRYAHGVLGDTVEYGGLEIRLRSGQFIEFVLPEERVFEDLSPRLFDLDLDGDQEVIVVESDAATGAQLVIYDDTGKIAATPHIGTRFRWLAPIGAADLDGDGHIEIAYIDRPHLAKTLRIWRYADGKLTEIAAQSGLTNHRIGEDFISGGIRDCGTGPELITANASWSRVIASTLTNSQIATRDIAPFTGPSSLAATLACK